MNALQKRLLRERLIRKAKRGAWDERMCTLHGVSPRVNAGCRRAIVRGYRHRLIPTSTTGGSHAPGSYHTPVNQLGRPDPGGVGRAVDLGVMPHVAGTPLQLRRLKAHQRREFERHTLNDTGLVELVGPLNNLAILRDHPTKLVEHSTLEDQHDNHLHEAFTL